MLKSAELDKSTSSIYTSNMYHRRSSVLLIVALFAWPCRGETLDSAQSVVLPILLESIGPQQAASLGPKPKADAAAKLVPELKRPAVLAALKGLEAQTSSTTTLREIMEASLILGQADQALASADKLREIAPGPESETTHAWALSQTGDFPGAFAAAQELEKLYPERSDVKALLAYTRARVRPTRVAAVSIPGGGVSDGAVLAGEGRSPREASPEALALMRASVTARQNGDLDGTLSFARQAMSADPGSRPVQEFYRITVADRARWSGENPEALADINRAVKAKSEGRWEAALAYMESAASKEPHPNIFRALEKLRADAQAARSAPDPKPGSDHFPWWPAAAGFGLGAAGFAVLGSRGTRSSEGESWPAPGRLQEFVAGAAIVGAVTAALVVTGRAAWPMARAAAAPIIDKQWRRTIELVESRGRISAVPARDVSAEVEDAVVRISPRANSAMQTLTKAAPPAAQEFQAAVTRGDRVRNLLMPGGQVLGQDGSNYKIRIMQGTVHDAEALFSKLTQGARIVPHPGRGALGKLAQLPNGDFIGLRYASKSGPPTIDVEIVGIAIKKVKFLSP